LPASSPISRYEIAEYLAVPVPTRRRALLSAMEGAAVEVLNALLHEGEPDLHSRIEDCVQLARLFAGRATEHELTRAREALADEAEASSVRRVALELLLKHDVKFKWAELDAYAGACAGDGGSGFVQRCLALCSKLVAEEDRTRFLHYLEAPGALRRLDPRAVQEAVQIVAPLLGEGVRREDRERALKACLALLQHDNVQVRHETLDAMLPHCTLEMLERLRFLRREVIDAELIERIQALVNRLWREPIDLMTVSPTGFEHLARIWFEAKGYTSVSHSGRVGDGGIDLQARSPDDVLCVIQCKRWRRDTTVGRREIERIRDAARRIGAGRAILWTTSRFGRGAGRVLAEAREGASNVTIDLIDGAAIIAGFDRAWGEGSVRIRAGGGGSLLTMRLDASTARFQASRQSCAAGRRI
jgi:hypothetical protein